MVSGTGHKVERERYIGPKLIASSRMEDSSWLKGQSDKRLSVSTIESSVNTAQVDILIQCVELMGQWKEDKQMHEISKLKAVDSNKFRLCLRSQPNSKH